MKLIKSPCSSRTRITFLDKIGTPNITVVFSKRRGNEWLVRVKEGNDVERRDTVEMSSRPSEEDAERIYLKVV